MKEPVLSKDIRCGDDMMSRLHDRRYTRRAMFQSALRGSSLIALSGTVPGFLATTARAAGPEREGRVLVVIQLDGGNDGINTVVPFRDEGYARNRRSLRLDERDVIKVGDGIGLHPAMKGAGRLFESGRLAIVQGVGYPNPNRSHFESMAIWHSGRALTTPRRGPGWLGGALDSHDEQRDGGPSMLYVGWESVPPALWGRASAAVAIDRPDDFKLNAEIRADLGDLGERRGDDLAAFVLRSTLDAYASADRMAELARGHEHGRGYPETALGGRLRMVAQLLEAGLGARVYYTVQAGYDTHAIQPAQHARLLEELSTALEAFLDDLALAKLADRVAVLCFSEFGRRVAENDSAGTDHGTAGPVLIAGGKVRPGLAGTTPSLIDLADGDLKWSVDFRRIYASVLEQWLEIPGQARVVGAEPLSIFRT